jgi:pimeloyl-ACP methyl ester carboxylesterase
MNNNWITLCATRLLAIVSEGIAMQRLFILFALLLCAGCSSTVPLDDQARAAAPGDFVQLSQGQVHYQLEGPHTGETVVLVHGGSVPMFTWERTVPALTRAGFRVLSYDLYGRGYTDRPDVAYDEDLFDTQLVELLDALDIREPVHLVGLSMGGAIATIFTARHPAKVRRLGLIAPGGFPVKWPFFAKLALVPGLGNMLMSVLGERIIKKSIADNYFDPSQVEPFLAEFEKQMAYDGYKRALLRTAKDLNQDQASAYEQVGKLGKPTLLIWGRQDLTAPFEHSEKVMALIPHTIFHPIDGTGHIPHYEKPALVSPLIVAFLQE